MHLAKQKTKVGNKRKRAGPMEKRKHSAKERYGMSQALLLTPPITVLFFSL